MTVCLDHVDLTVRSSVIAGGATVAVLEDLARAHERAQLLLDAHAPVGLDDLVGRDPAFRRAIDDARRAAASDAPLLMTGEPGTGKTVLAHAVHAASSRSAQPLVIADARGIPRERLESELFGWDAGAVPGARSTARPGLLERAGVGTLVVESIDAAPLDVQVRIADVLRRRVAARVGGRREIPIRARIVATAVRDLEAGASEAESSVHRELAARLCTVHVRIPPLRDRRSDVPALVEHFLGRHAERIGSRRVRITPGVLAQLEAHHWPGNVRELASTVELAASRLPTGIDVIDTVPAAIVRASGRGEIPTPLRPGALLPADHEPVLTLDEIERRVYRHALQQHGGNVAQAARALGVARGTFYNKLKRYGEKGD